MNVRTPGSPPSGLERLLARDRWLIGGTAAVLVLGAWTYLWSLARSMAEGAASAAMPDMPGMPSMSGSMTDALAAAPAPWTWHTFELTAAMWWVMMIGMMVPSAAPMILLFGGIQRRHLADSNPVWRVALFTGGYLMVWAGFSLAAAGAQWALVTLGLLAPVELKLATTFGALLVVLAGLYQLTPLKNVCLRHCRSPVEFLTSHWRRGAAGAVRMGLEHGTFCVGCCWLLMALLFAVGVMNLVWVVALATLVLLEKLAPRGVLLARSSGIAMLVFAAYLLVAPAVRG